MPKTSGSMPETPRPAIRAIGVGADLGGGFLARDQHRGGAVVERRRVSRGHRAVLGERRPALGELVERDLGLDVLVAAEIDVGEADHPVLVETRIPGRRRVAMAGERELVLAIARDLEPRSEQLRALTERDRPLLGHPRVDHAPAERRRVQGLRRALETAIGLGHNPRGAAHRFHAAREHHGRVAGLDRPARLDGRLEARRAEAVDRDPGDACRQAGEQHGHARHVAVLLARAVGVAEDDVVEAPRIEAGIALADRGHHVGREVVGSRLRECPAVAPERRANRIDHVGVRHAAASLRPDTG